MMLDRIDQLVEAKADLVIETTQASLFCARQIPIWRERGYNVSPVYLRLGSIAESLARVRRRVEAGGHSIPAEAIEGDSPKASATSRQSTNQSSMRGTSGKSGRRVLSV
jgi:predicted ABC-type ATPase